MRSRFTRQPEGGLILQERDKSFLADLYRHRAMSRAQVQHLYFHLVRYCNERLRQLFDHGYVNRHYLPAAPFGAQAVYTVGRSSCPLIACYLGIDAADVKTECRNDRTPTFLARIIHEHDG